MLLINNDHREKTVHTDIVFVTVKFSSTRKQCIYRSKILFSVSVYSDLIVTVAMQCSTD